MVNRSDQIKEPLLRVIRTQRIASWILMGTIIVHVFKQNRWNFIPVGLSIIYIGLSGFYIMHMTQKRAGVLYNDWDSPSRFVEQSAPDARSVRVKLWVKNVVVLALGFYAVMKPFVLS